MHTPRLDDGFGATEALFTNLPFFLFTTVKACTDITAETRRFYAVLEKSLLDLNGLVLECLILAAGVYRIQPVKT